MTETLQSLTKELVQANGQTYIGKTKLESWSSSAASASRAELDSTKNVVRAYMTTSNHALVILGAVLGVRSTFGTAYRGVHVTVDDPPTLNSNGIWVFIGIFALYCAMTFADIRRTDTVWAILAAAAFAFLGSVAMTYGKFSVGSSLLLGVVFGLGVPVVAIARRLINLGRLLAILEFAKASTECEAEKTAEGRTLRKPKRLAYDN